MEKTIKTRHINTTIIIDEDNVIRVKRQLHSHGTTYHFVPILQDYLSDNKCTSYTNTFIVTATIAEIMPKTAEIEQEIDRMLGGHNGIQTALTAELEALSAATMTPNHILDLVDTAVLQAIAVDHARIMAALSAMPPRVAVSKIKALI